MPNPTPSHLLGAQVTVVDDMRIVVNDILNENTDELPEFRDRVIKVSLGGWVWRGLAGGWSTPAARIATRHGRSPELERAAVT